MDEALKSNFGSTEELKLQQLKYSHMMSKSLIKISKREIEVRLIKMAYDAINKQVSSMSKAIEMASSKLDEKVDTKFQGFAPTLSDYHEK